MAQARDALSKLKDAIKDFETTTSQDSEMYYTTRWPGVYIAENFASIPGHISIVLQHTDHLGRTPGYSYLWDSTWGISLSGPTVNMADRAGSRVHGVLLIEADLPDVIEILYKPADGPGVRTQVNPFTERDQGLMDHVASKDSTERRGPQDLDNPVEGMKPSSRATGSEAIGGAANAAEDRTGPKGKASVTMKMPAHAAQSESESEDEDRANFLCCRRDGSGTYYLIVDDTKAYHKRLRPAAGVGFDDEAFTRMHEEGPQEPYQPFELSENSSIEISPFPKGYTFRFIACGLSSKRKQQNSTDRLTVDDVSFHVIYPESNDLPHRDYVMDVDGTVEGKNYPQWHYGIAKHNEDAWDEFIAQLEALVTDAGGSWSDNRP